MKNFKGVITALVTPFNENNEVDYKALDKCIQFQLKNGIKAIVVLGTTGEASTLSQDEKDEIIKITKKAVKDRAKIIVGAGSNNTAEAVRLARHYEKFDIDALLEVTPYYNKANSVGLYNHYYSIAKATKLPIIIYNVPSRTGVNIGWDVVEKLSKIENIIGIKEASGNLINCMEILSKTKRFKVFCGDDNLTLAMLAMGACGVISVASNIIPSDMNLICSSVFEGNLASAKNLHYKNYEVFKKLFYDVNPIPVKFYLSKMGLIENVLRLPLTAMEEENIKGE